MKILNKLTIKHLKMNKKRTIVTIIGIVLSTALMVGIGLLFSSLRDNSIKTTIARTGEQHVTILDVPSDKLKLIENNVEIEKFKYQEKRGYAYLEGTENNYKPYLWVNAVDKDLLSQFTLLEGRLPQNENEIVISSHIRSNGGVTYKMGDMLNLQVGKRTVNGEEITTDDEYMEGETLSSLTTQSYKIVGIVERTFIEPYSAPGYMVFTVLENTKKVEKVNAYINYKNVKNIYKKADVLGESLGFSKSELSTQVDYNDSLLSTYGVSRYSNIMDSMMGLIIIVLVLISIGCIVVIYNSFAISVMERKKQFGLFSSIGSTRKQLRHTVFFEAIIVGGIGIPLGVISAIGGIGVVIMIVNQMLPDAFQFPLALSIYPTFIIIPVCFMIGVILVSAFLPAHRASKITPIEAIRQNDDIKIKGKKLKTNKFIRKIFGMEGEIALKNIKRNKKKYRITIVSLFISIVLFISFSSLMYYGIYATNDMAMSPDFDLNVTIQDKDKSKEIEDLYAKVKANEETKKSTYVRTIMTNADNLEKQYSDEAKTALKKCYSVSEDNTVDTVLDIPISLVSLDDDAYKAYLKELKLTKEVPILLNRSSDVDYRDGKRKVINFDVFEKKLDSITPYTYVTNVETDENVKKPLGEIKDIYYADKEPFGLSYSGGACNPIIILSKTQFNEIVSKAEQNSVESMFFIKAPVYKQLDKMLKDVDNDKIFESYYYNNFVEAMQLQKNMIFVLNLLLYGFISLVTLIGVTSVFNTIGTSIALRRKEFAMLRSMGLTPKGFNKILYFESLFFGLKSLLYAIPVSLLITYFISVQIGNMVTAGFMIPWTSILIAVVGVFIIVFISMMYASAKIKKENILDAIREENI